MPGTVSSFMRPLALVAFMAATTVAGGQSSELPDIGSAANATVTISEEYRVGAMIVRQLRDQNKIVEDPEIQEYVQGVGTRVSSQAQEGQHRFTFFVVRDPGINAFALPGGFIGVNQGLILATANESELASVLAHEVAHVTQRHIARAIQAQSRQSLATAAAVLAAILIGAAAGGGGDVMQGGIAAAQGMAIQQQINFTRSNEYEADRVGIGFLAAAGFNPQAMPAFFETMGRRAGLAGENIPEFIRTHPVTANRIAESRDRAEQLDTKRKPAESIAYALIRERIRVLFASQGSDVRDYYMRRDDPNLKFGEQYGKALALMQKNQARDAVEILNGLIADREDIIQLYTAYGQAMVEAGQINDGVSFFSRSMSLFPRNVPLTVRYAEALMKQGRPKEAHTVLLDLFNVVPPTPAQIRLTALAASAAGDMGDAYYYMSEYHIASGDLPLSEEQLELALETPNLTPVQRQRFQARLDEIREVLEQDRRSPRARAASDTKQRGGSR
jgi:predicted Zn-dependent protease